MNTLGQCQAHVSHPPYYIDDFRCERPAKYDRSGLRVCGIHARVLQRMNGHIPLGWPQPKPPPYPGVDDEALVVPRDDNQKENPHA